MFCDSNQCNGDVERDVRGGRGQDTVSLEGHCFGRTDGTASASQMKAPKSVGRKNVCLNSAISLLQIPGRQPAVVQRSSVPGWQSGPHLNAPHIKLAPKAVCKEVLHYMLTTVWTLRAQTHPDPCACPNVSEWGRSHPCASLAHWDPAHMTTSETLGPTSPDAE